MSDNCCPTSALQEKRSVLIIVLLINAVMFFVQTTAAYYAHSNALLADAFDMLGDALTYALSLYAATRGQRWLVKAALFKGIIIAIFSISILFDAAYKLFYSTALPKISIMYGFSLLGLLANVICFYLLSRHREKDINMRSTWICARNDIMVNISVLITAVLVAITASRWPDIIIGTVLAVILGLSAIKIIREAIKQY